MSTVIKEPQQMFLKIIRKILKVERGINASDLRFYTKPPVSLLGAIAPSEFISIREGREIFHLPELTPQQMQELMDEKAKAKENVKESNNDQNKEDATNN
jgi:hypothetical protein